MIVFHQWLKDMTLDDVFRLGTIMEDQTEDILTSATPTVKMPSVKWPGVKVATKSVVTQKPIGPNIIPKVLSELLCSCTKNWSFLICSMKLMQEPSLETVRWFITLQFMSLRTGSDVVLMSCYMSFFNQIRINRVYTYVARRLLCARRAKALRKDRWTDGHTRRSHFWLQIL